LRDNGWFVFFAPRDNPQIAGVCSLARRPGGVTAAPIAKHVLEAFFAKKESRPLPQLSSKTFETSVSPTDDPAVEPAPASPAFDVPDRN
jgi:hypothetical protein